MLNPSSLRRIKRAATCKGSRFSSTYPAYVDVGNGTVSSVRNVRVASSPVEGDASSVSVWVNSGTIHEHNDQLGSANLLRAVLTSNIAREVARLGGSVSSSTCREYTCYNVQCLKDNVPRVLSILGQNLSPSGAIDEASVNAERAPILIQQSNMIDNADQSVILDYLHSAAYQRTPYGNAPVGNKAGVTASNASTLQTLRQESYDASRTVVSVASSLNADQIASAVNQSFNLPAGKGRSTFESTRPDFVGSLMNIRDDTLPRAQVAIGYETFGYAHEDILTLEILRALIGQWNVKDFSGRFSSHGLAENFSMDKLVDSYNTFNFTYNNTGMFGVYAVSKEEEKFDDAVYEVFNSYQRLLSHISPHDIFRAKHMVIANYLNSISTPSGLAGDAGKQVSTIGRRIPPSEFIARIKAIKESDVFSLIETYFYDVDPVVVGHGPIHELPDYAIMRGWTYWNRW